MKKTIERIWAHRRGDGWVIQRTSLLEALKKGEVMEFGGVMVGTRELRKLVNLMAHEDCLIRANGRLEIETVQRVIRTRNGKRRTGFTKPKHSRQWFALVKNAWVPPGATRLVAIRPRKY